MFYLTLCGFYLKKISFLSFHFFFSFGFSEFEPFVREGTSLHIYFTILLIRTFTEKVSKYE